MPMANVCDIERVIARIQDWVRNSDETNAAMASVIGVDEKVVRQAAGEAWNPRASTLRKFVAAMPAEMREGSRRQPRRSAGQRKAA